MTGSIPAPRILALDFDGVICDGMREFVESSWRANAVAFGSTPDPSRREEIARRFAALRPAIESGWEMVLMIAVLAERDVSGDGELRERWAAVRDEWIARRALRTSALGEALDRVRDDWVRQDKTGWLGSHQFYPPMAAWLRGVCEQGLTLYVVTTKEARFSFELLAGQKVPIARDRVIGKQTPRREKWDVLRELAARHGLPPDGEGLWFVEDRFETLRGLHEKAPDLSAARLYLADWGYVFADRDMAEAARHGRIQRIGLADVQAGFHAWPAPPSSRG
jgi:hypothetical protein